MDNIENKKIAVIGLGYVGLPLAVEFGKFFHTIGFDINQHRINELLEANDSTLEVNSNELKEAIKLSYTSNAEEIENCNIFIISHLVYLMKGFRFPWPTQWEAEFP